MPRENVLTTAAARVAGIPFALRRRAPVHEPHKALILQTCCLSQVMLATPMLAALSRAYPAARFDWLLGSWARPAVAGNPRVAEILDIGEFDLPRHSWRQIGQLILRLRQQRYDTAFVPSRSALLSYIAWQAGIPQRLGLNIQGRGFAHTVPVTPAQGVRNKGAQALLIAEAAGVRREITGAVCMEFYPPDSARTAMTRRLVEEVDWLGDVPLVIVHIGGGRNPRGDNGLLRWPEERFVVLSNHLMRAHRARVLLVGTAAEEKLAREVAGMLLAPVANYCGRLTLGELGALCEVADLYVGNDTGPSHVAAATGCPTLVIYGPTDPALSAPYTTLGNVQMLWRDRSAFAAERPFTWDIGVTAGEAIEAAEGLLRQPADRRTTMAILSGRPRENN